MSSPHLARLSQLDLRDNGIADETVQGLLRSHWPFVEL